MAFDFQRHQTPFLRTFGEPVTFWPGDDDETVVTAIVYRSARPEIRTPGNVTSVFFVLSDLPAQPAKNDIVQIGEEQFLLGDPNDNGDGSASIIVRKKSQTT